MGPDEGHMGRRGLTIAAGFAALMLCAGHCDTPPADVRPKPVEAGTPEDCAAACAHMAQLGCEEAKPTPKGATCEDVCNNVESSGTITLSPACVVKITKCEEIDSCTYGAAP